VSTAQERHAVIRRRTSCPASSERDYFVGGFDASQVGAVRRREIVPRAGFPGEKESSIHRRGELGTSIRITGKCIRRRSSRQWMARRARFNERPQASAKAGTEQFDKLSDGEIEKRARSRGLELIRQPPAEKSFDEGPVKRTQMIAAGRGHLWIAD